MSETSDTRSGSLHLSMPPELPSSSTINIWDHFRAFCGCRADVTEPCHEWDQSQNTTCPSQRHKAVKFVVCKHCPELRSDDYAAFTQRIQESFGEPDESTKTKRSKYPGHYRFLGSTSTFLAHLRNVHVDAYARIGLRQAILTQPTAAPLFKDQDPRKKTIDLKLLKLIFAQKLPLCIVESATFKELLTALNPSYKPPCRKTLSLLLSSHQGCQLSLTA